MKRILQISLALNVVLLAVAGWRNARETPMPRPLRMEITPSAQKPLRSRPLANDGAMPSPSTPWNALEDADPRVLIARLRAIGCPEQTIRDIVTLRICRQFRNRLLEAQSEGARSWNFTRQQTRQMWKEINAQQRDLRDEMISTLESVFGEPWQQLTASVFGGPVLWRYDRLASFSVEARQKIRDVDREYRESIDDLQHKQYTGELGTEDIAALRELDRRKQAALAAVLSPQELEEYLYRESPAAEYVRQNLPEAKSEDEFRAMVRLALEMDMSGTADSLRASDAYSGDLGREVAQRRTAFNEKLKELLGEPRIAEQNAEEQKREQEAAKRRELENEQQARAHVTQIAAETGVSAEDAGRFSIESRNYSRP